MVGARTPHGPLFLRALDILTVRGQLKGVNILEKPLAKHHTMADWDYSTSPTNVFLSDDTYVSAPTCLKQPAPGSGGYSDVVLCRIPATLLLPQGEVRNWMSRFHASYVPAYFRNQAPLGFANFLNTYGVLFFGTTLRLQRWTGGGLSTRDETTCQQQVAAWTHFRIFWYNGLTPAEQDAICVDCYIEVAGEWVKQGSTLYDTSNLWKDSAINRCGFFIPSLAPHPCYADDTEIWGPV